VFVYLLVEVLKVLISIVLHGTPFLLLFNVSGNCTLQVVATRNKLAGKKIPLLVKIAPDLSMQQKEDIAAVVSKKGASKLLCLVEF